MSHPILQLGSNITVAPVVHGSGDFAWEVRRLFLSEPFDCLAVPLPESFRADVEQAILELPLPSAVVQRNYPDFAVESDASPLIAQRLDAVGGHAEGHVHPHAPRLTLRLQDDVGLAEHRSKSGQRHGEGEESGSGVPKPCRQGDERGKCGDRDRR